MTTLHERALFFAAGLLFGAALGFLLAGQAASPPGPASPEAARAASPEDAPAPPPGARPPDPDRLETLLAEVESRPEDPAARAAVGDLYLDVREFGEAAYWLQQARNLNPRDLDLRSRLAFALFGRGDVPAATASWEAVLAEDPDHFPSLLALGRLRLFVEQDLEAGIGLWERAIAAAPDSAEADALRAELEALRAAHPE